MLDTNWPTLTINSWIEFNQTLEFLKLEQDWMSHYLFRGQSDNDWTLKPNLLRILNKYNIDRELGLKFEKTLEREYISKAHFFKQTKIVGVYSGQTALNFSIMQHYGVPTRLLDWSSSPYVALYFAISSNLDKDGALYLFNTTLMESVLKEEKYITEKDNLFINQEESNYLAPVITNFESLRYSNQQACFTIAADLLKDHYELIYKALMPHKSSDATPFIKLIIPQEKKHEFLARLRKINVKPDILFPDVEGFAASLKDLMHLRGWEKNLQK